MTPAATVEEAEPHWAAIDAAHCKNLFLRNQKGTKHYLVIVNASKKVDLRAVAEQIGDGKLSFASPDAFESNAFPTIVSQNVDAVSASAIGVRRWYAVRSLRLRLWYAWPSS